MKNKSKRGFTLIEISIIVALIGILLSVSLAGFVFQRKATDLKGSAEEVINILRLAQSKTLGSTDNAQYGVYFSNSISPNQYILFTGANYASRNPSLDIVYSLPGTMEFYSINFNGGNELVFEKLTGETNLPGQLSLRIISDPSQSQSVFVSGSGAVSLLSPIAESDSNRVKDSRHVHFDYSRPSFVSCPLTDASLSLYFDGAGTPQQTISFCNNLIGGQLFWEGTVSVAGSDQIIQIRTHYLQDINYPNGTQFSVHRDRRFNDKSFRVTISGDSSGDIINYSADGLTTNYSSIYVSNLQWQ